MIVNQGIDYIMDNLCKKLSVEMIADHCCFSPYYYSRLFKSVAGESVYSFIKRLRLERSALMLLKTCRNMRVTDIAALVGYSSSNFAVFFREHYGMSPSQFRRNPRSPAGPLYDKSLKQIQVLQTDTPGEILDEMERNTFIEEMPPRIFHYTRVKGSYRGLSPIWKAFCREKEELFPDSQINYYGISYNDPLIVGVENCLYDLCIRIPDTSKKIEGNYRRIPGGRYLCYRIDRPISELQLAYSNFFALWIPLRGYRLRDGACLERYHTGLGPDGRISLDICIPIH